MLRSLTSTVPFLLIASGWAFAPPPVLAQCDDPLPIDPGIVTWQMKLKGFSGAEQAGPACHLRWEGGSSPAIMVYGPTPMAELGQTFKSTREAADQYAGESPKGVEPVPGVKGAYMVFDPSTPNRRVFVEYGKKVYMIVSQDQVPLAVLARAILQGSDSPTAANGRVSP
jgi:hypothetical protein